MPDPLIRRMASAAGWSLCAAVLGRSCMLAVWVICGRMLAKGEFGGLTLVYSTINLLGSVGALGLGSTATRYVSELSYTDRAKAGRLLGTSYVLSFASGILLAVALVAWANPLASQTLGHANLGRVLQVGALLIPFCAVNAHQIGALAGLQAFRQMTTLSFWTGLFAVMVMPLGAHYGLMGAVWALAAWRILVSFAYHIVLARECERQNIRATLELRPEDRRVLWQFSLPALLTSLVFPASMWLCSVWLMRSLNGSSQLALYGAADRWHATMLFVPTAMFSAVTPMLCAMIGERNRNGFRKVLYTNAAVCLVLAGVPAALFALAAPLAMRTFGPSYVAGASTLRLLCVASIPEVINGVVGQVVALRSMWIRFGFDVLLASILLLGSYALIPRFAAEGLAAAYAFSFSAVAAGLLLYAGRSSRSSVPQSSLSAEISVEA